MLVDPCDDVCGGAADTVEGWQDGTEGPRSRVEPGVEGCAEGGVCSTVGGLNPCRVMP